MAGRKKVTYLTYQKRLHKCPHCGAQGQTRITRTKKHKDYIERYHECKACGTRYSTTGDNLDFFRLHEQQKVDHSQGTFIKLDINAEKIGFYELQAAWNKLSANWGAAPDYSQPPLEEVTL